MNGTDAPFLYPSERCPHPHDKRQAVTVSGFAGPAAPVIICLSCGAYATGRRITPEDL